MVGELQQFNYDKLSLPLGELMFVVFLCTFHSLVQSMLATAAGDDSQTTPVQITHVFFVLCCSACPIYVQQHNT